MPTYEHLCQACQQQFELIYSIKADPPTQCPSCQVEGQVVRLISGGSGKGVVELTGHEYREKVVKEAQELKREVYKNENLLANLVGEQKYQSNTVQNERVAKEQRPKIRYR